MGPLQGFLPGLSSYRFFTILDRNESKALRIVQKRRSLLALQQIETGFSPLHVAANRGQLELIKAVLARNDCKHYLDLQNNEKQWTPLHCAVRQGNVEAVSLLLQASPNIHLRNKDGCSALHIAAGHGLVDMVKLLVSKGLSVDEADSGNQWTSLHYTAMKGYLELTQWLVSEGAKPGAVDKSGFTPMFLAILHGQDGTFEYLFQFKDSFKTKTKLKPIHLAAQSPTSTILDFLHRKRYDIKELDNPETQAQPIHYAAYGRSLACLQYLLEKGIDPNTVDKSGSTALHLAVINQDLDSVDLLCDSGADPSIPNEKNLTPRDIAESLNNSHLLSTLRRARASRSD
jgi:ankyrin repeat protein